jgi:hypothetical protein
MAIHTRSGVTQLQRPGLRSQSPAAVASGWPTGYARRMLAARLNLVPSRWVLALACLSACDEEDLAARDKLQSTPDEAQPLVPGPDQLAIEGPPGLACGDPITIDPRRSLAITDQALLTPFDFGRVMQQIVDTSGEQGLTREALYGRWWDYLNVSPGAFPEARHCDDDPIKGKPSLGAFPTQCPRPEGVLAFTDPFESPGTNPDAYVPVGVFNRFDLAPTDGAHCGEYRIVFAKRSGISDPNDRNLIIFEAVLPNPAPDCGVEGCRAVAEMWHKLGTTNNAAQIRAALDTFYFGNGVGKGPVVHADNYGPKGGQIRTNGFMPDPNLWQLRQFVFDHDCEFGPCIRPTLLKDNPHPQLFTDPSPGAGGIAFKSWFVKQVKNLEVADVNRFFLTDVGTFNAGQSTSEGQFDIYRLQSGDSSPFRDAIEAAITKPGVTTDQILNRTLTLSCAGCHEHANSVENGDLGGGLPWAPSLGFVQVSEEFTENGAFGPRFPLSDQLTQIFLPHRKQVLEKFLATAVCSNCSPLKVKLFGADIVDPHKFDPPGPSAPGLTLGGPPRSH